MQSRRVEDDIRSDLALHLLRIVRDVHPEFVVCENVAAFKRSRAHDRLVQGLWKIGYTVQTQVLDAYDLGVPQHRLRFTLVASLIGQVEPWTHARINGPRTVREAIAGLPRVRAGKVCPSDRFHFAPRLSAVNLQRIRESKPGGTWKDWSEDLVCGCHRRGNGPKYPSVYGRMSWDNASPTITTQAYNYGSGRFGHPEQDRAITLREAAIIQGFPRSYVFVDPSQKVRVTQVGEMIGNAVPVPVARALAREVAAHIRSQGLLGSRRPNSFSFGAPRRAKQRPAKPSQAR